MSMISGISSMFGGKSNLTPEQQESVKESMAIHNTHRAYQKVKDSIEANKGKSNNVMSMSNSNPYKTPYSMKFNPIRNQYKSMSGVENNDKRWY